jgi:LPXTG-site transpeptidase (sortase) family protein
VRVPPAIVAEGTCLEVDLRDSASGPGTGPEMKALGRMIEARMISPNGTSLNIIPIPLQVCYKYNAEDLERAFFNPVNLMIGSALLGELNWEFPATSVFPAIQQVCFSTLDLGFYGLFMPVVLPSTGYAPDEPVIQSLHSTVTVSKSQDDMWLVIPRMGIRTPIVGVPVTSDGWDVSWLGNAAGWLQGSAFPTWQGNSVLTGHVWGVTNQPGPFINLNTLWFGDQVIVHAWGQEYIYEVRSIKQVLPEDLGELLTHEELPWLTLVTCRGFDPGEGTYHWRVLVRAVLVEIK